MATHRCPPTVSPLVPVTRPLIMPRPRPPAPAPPKPPTPQVKVETPGPAVIKKEAVITKTEVKPEEGEIVEKSVLGILRGRNPVMFCNDQSKMRNLHMEWEQV